MNSRRVLPRPQNEDPQSLGFTPQEPMKHQAPLTVLRAIMTTASSVVFGDNDERRDTAGQPLPEYLHPEVSYAEQSELWFDFVADTGDGFLPAYTVARALVEPSLTVGGQPTKRGELLVLSGDLVYPSPSRRAYRDHTIGPFRAASPIEGTLAASDAVVLPGANDWHDGLAAFRTTFLQGGWFGSWRLRQTRSYIAVALPHRYWIWAIDSELGLDVDPQRKYFQDAATKLREGDRVILCGYRALWLDERLESQSQLQTLIDLVQQVNAELILQLSGQHHVYARYTGPSGETRAIVCGGGGAFTEDPSGVARRATLAERTPVELTRKDCFPSHKDATRLRRTRIGMIVGRAFCLGFWGTVFILLGLYTKLRDTPASTFQGSRFSSVEHLLGPGMIVICVVFCVLTVAFARQTLPHAPRRAALLGILHAFGYFVPCTLSVIAIGSYVEGPLRFPLSFLALVAEMPFVLMAYYFICDQLGLHRREIMRSLQVNDFKFFLRGHVAKDGALTLFPIGIPDVPKHATFTPYGGAETAWFELSKPIGDLVMPISPPIVVPPNAQQIEAVKNPVPIARDVPYDLFLSYSRADAAWVSAFLDAVEARAKADGLTDLRVFIDTESLRRGDYWRTRIVEEITRCHCFVAVWSGAYENAYRSKRMCFVEYEEARRRELGEPGVVFDLLVASKEPLGAAGAQQAIYLNDVPAEKIAESEVFHRLYADLVARIRKVREAARAKDVVSSVRD